MTGRGRPARAPTAAERAKVKELLGEGASQRVIAAALGRSVPNLRKFFAIELGLENKSAAAAPPFPITAQMRADVALLAACNEPRVRIARAIGVSEDDLGTWFAEDLEIGAARYRLKSLQRLEKLADLGSLGAVAKLAAITSPLPEAAAGSGPPVGKKAAARAAAEAAAQPGGKFAPRTPPRLAVVGGTGVDRP